MTEQAEALPSGQRSAFAVPSDIAYFNTANLSPQLHAVRAAGEAALERRARPWTISASDWFSDVERLRGLVGGDADGVALVPATSYGFAVAARNLPLALVTGWWCSPRSTRRASTPGAPRPGRPNVHWTDGARIDLAEVSTRTREIGAKLVIDGSQSIGAVPFDVAVIRPDFVVSVGYKWLLGPFGVGYLYVADEHRGGEPVEQNWILREGSEDFARLVDYRDEYQPGARRFDVGERTKFELLPMAIAALDQLRTWGIPRIAATLSELTGQIAARAVEVGLDPLLADQRGPHMLGVRLPDTVRSGIVAALASANCFAAVRGESLRISPHLHVTDSDIECLLNALEAAKRAAE